MAIKTFTTGEVLTASDTNTYLNNGGLVWIKSQSITSGSNTEITSVFSSTYTNYRIVLSNIKLGATANVTMRMGTTSTGIYYYAGNRIPYTGTPAQEFSTSGTDWLIGVIGSTGNISSGTIELSAPQLAGVTTFSCIGADPRTDGAAARIYSGFINNTTQYTSFSLLCSGTTFTTCNVDVYGYRIQ